MAYKPNLPFYRLVTQILHRVAIAAYNRRSRIRLLERDFQPKLIEKLRELFPDCLILKNDSAYLQGIPDLSIFFEDRWAMLEVKKSEKSTYEPNQEFYLQMLNEMSFAARIDPSNEQEVLRALQHALTAPRRNSRVSQRK
jgi:hypothetical protein